MSTALGSTRQQVTRRAIIAAARAWRFMRTCTRAAKYLPAVRRAVPWYVWPILGLAALIKCMPFDGGTDEALFALAFALIAWRRPGLLKALYREAQAGKPARCACERCGRPRPAQAQATPARPAQEAA